MKLQLHSAGAASRLAALLLVQILPVLHPTVHNTHGGDPALRSSRRSAGVPTARTVRRGVERPGASPPSVRRWTFTTGCYDGSSASGAREEDDDTVDSGGRCRHHACGRAIRVGAGTGRAAEVIRRRSIRT